MRRIGPIDAGHRKPAFRQPLREVADGTAHIQHPAPFAMLRKLRQQQWMAAVTRRFVPVPGSLGCRCHLDYYDTVWHRAPAIRYGGSLRPPERRCAMMEFDAARHENFLGQS